MTQNEKHICENFKDDDFALGICAKCKEHACGVRCTDCGTPYQESNCCHAQLLIGGEEYDIRDQNHER